MGVACTINMDRLCTESDMATAKEQMSRIIEAQPENSSYEEILRELACERMVERGLADSDQGRTISNEEMQERIQSWRWRR
jgi:predicted transcriptional regulator